MERVNVLDNLHVPGSIPVRLIFLGVLLLTLSILQTPLPPLFFPFALRQGFPCFVKISNLTLKSSKWFKYQGRDNGVVTPVSPKNRTKQTNRSMTSVGLALTQILCYCKHLHVVMLPLACVW